MGRALLWITPLLLTSCVAFDAKDPPDDPTPGGGGSGSGSGSSSGSGTDPALERRQAFDQTVYPIMTTKCATCHTYGDAFAALPDFVEMQDPTRAYDVMKLQSGVLGQPAFAAILDQPLANYTADDLVALNLWIALERSGP
jgi:hypothetical protein